MSKSPEQVQSFENSNHPNPSGFDEAFRDSIAIKNTRNHCKPNDLVFTDPYTLRGEDKERDLLSEKFSRILSSPKDSQQLIYARAEINLFEAQAHKRGLPNKEIARMLHQLNLLLTVGHCQAKLPLIERSKVARQVLLHAAFPEDLDQGQHNTCTMAAIEKVLYWRQPSKVAEVVTESVLTGCYHDLDADGFGNKISIPDSTFKPGTEEQSCNSNNCRDFASQIFQVTVGNAITQARQPKQLYEQVGNEEILLNAINNKRIEDSTNNPIKGPNITMLEAATAFARLSGQTGVFLANKCVAQSPVVEGFGSERELKNLLLSKQHKMPIILAVNVYSSLFNLTSKNSETGWHLVTIHAIQGDRAFVSTEWGIEHDRWATLKELFDATHTGCSEQ